jgi:hypothetical protein
MVLKQALPKRSTLQTFGPVQSLSLVQTEPLVHTLVRLLRHPWGRFMKEQAEAGSLMLRMVRSKVRSVDIPCTELPPEVRLTSRLTWPPGAPLASAAVIVGAAAAGRAMAPTAAMLKARDNENSRAGGRYNFIAVQGRSYSVAFTTNIETWK